MRHKSLWIVIILMVLLVFVTNCVPFQRICTVAKVWIPSSRCGSFYEWVCMIQRQHYLTFMDHTPKNISCPKEPHFILCNHISSHFSLGSFLTLAGLVQSPANIVCYHSYNELFMINRTVHHILRHEISIDVQCSKLDKEYIMRDGIQDAFNRGNNVVMFIDAHAPRKTIRSLNKKVLEYFPSYLKQLVHIVEPSNVNTFAFQRYPPTSDLDEIIRYRTDIIKHMYHKY